MPNDRQIYAGHFGWLVLDADYRAFGLCAFGLCKSVLYVKSEFEGNICCRIRNGWQVSF